MLFAQGEKGWGWGEKWKRRVSISNQNIWDHQGDPLAARAGGMLKAAASQNTPQWVFITESGIRAGVFRIRIT